MTEMYAGIWLPRRVWEAISVLFWKNWSKILTKLLQNGCNGGENRLQCKLESNRTDVMSSEKEEKKEI